MILSPHKRAKGGEAWERGCSLVRLATHIQTDTHTLHSQNVRDHSNGPAVDGLAVRLSPEYLRGHIARCAAGSSKLVNVTLFGHLGEAKVTDHNL